MGVEFNFFAIFSTVRAYGIDEATAAAISNSLLNLTRLQSRQTVAASSDLTRIARLFHKSSLRRQAFVGAVADDPGWNMLLAIFADQTDDYATSITSACYASGGAPTTALRHLCHLEQRGLIRRSADPHDRRRSNVALTAPAYEEMTQLILSFCVAPPASATPAEERAIPPGDRA